jgi:hypothetical protein
MAIVKTRLLHILTQADQGHRRRFYGQRVTRIAPRVPKAPSDSSFSFPLTWGDRIVAILIDTKLTFVEHIDKSADRDRKRAGMDPLTRHAEAIRELRQRTARDIIKIGEHLTRARKICGHGNWRPWLEREFGWTDDTALNFMNVYRWSEANPERIRNLALPWRSIYLLARPSTPEAVRQEVFDRTERGEPPSHARIEAAVVKARPKALLPSYKTAPEPPTQDDIINQIIDLFKQLDRRGQSCCAIKLRNILQGRA